MKCVSCKTGELSPGLATVTLQRGGTTVVIKGVPADICDTCGEYYLSDEISGRVMAQAEEAVKHNVEIEIVPFAA